MCCWNIPMSLVTWCFIIMESCKLAVIGLYFPPFVCWTLSFIPRFHFIRLFWNQILIWFSVNLRSLEISSLLALVKYLLKWNSFSSSTSCFWVNVNLRLWLSASSLVSKDSVFLGGFEFTLPAKKEKKIRINVWRRDDYLFLYNRFGLQTNPFDHF